jgi:hypothetical protein
MLNSYISICNINLWYSLYIIIIFIILILYILCSLIIKCKENNIAGNDNIDRLRADIADRYEISVEQIDIREAGVSG